MRRVRKLILIILLFHLAWPYLASAQTLLPESADDVEATETERDVFGTLNDLKVQQNLLAPASKNPEFVDESDPAIPMALQPGAESSPVTSELSEQPLVEAQTLSTEIKSPENIPQEQTTVEAPIAATETPEFIFSSQPEEISIHILKPVGPVLQTPEVQPAAAPTILAEKAEPSKPVEVEAPAPKEYKVHLIPIKKVGHVNKSRKRDREPTNILDEED